MPEDQDEQRKRQEEVREQQSQSGSFNDVTEHYRTVMGVPDKPVDLNSMPKPLRYFGYFFMGAIVLFGVALIVIAIVQKWG